MLERLLVIKFGESEKSLSTLTIKDVIEPIDEDILSADISAMVAAKVLLQDKTNVVTNGFEAYTVNKETSKLYI